MNSADVLAAAGQCERYLAANSDVDWRGRIPDMEWSVAQAVAHAAEGPLWYAFSLAGGGAGVETMELRIKPDSSPPDLVSTLAAAARVLACVIDSSPPTSRGFHPWGQADPSGFAAMACDELLIHTDDAAQGLGVAFEPDGALCARVLARLFPEAPTRMPPSDGLRWANGRIALPGLSRRRDWNWHCAPLG
ncbi:MAG: maleylpyruvate isomerase N-terminal domain-containing protein [Chloroflexota bacterium]|nr:MAG: hypothetical protein DLM70_18585 [Chloroflexota bacterium]